jgi:hypothetical protein
MRTSIGLLAVIFLAANGGDGSGASSSRSVVEASCGPPDGIQPETTATPAPTGCFSEPSFQICGPASCENPCGPSEMAVRCLGAGPGSIPAPAAALGCAIIPIPTPSNALFYCCPCAG